MSAVRMVGLAAIRRRWRSLVVVALLIGVAGAAVLTATAGARRTSTTLDRFRAYSRSADLEVDVGDATPAQLAKFARDPSVAGVGVLHQIALTYADQSLPTAALEIVPAATAVDDSFGTVVDRPLVVDGRLPRNTHADELAIGESLAAKRHLRVGDHLAFNSYSIAQTQLAETGADPGPPAGPPVGFRIVGIVRRPLDLGVRGNFGGVLVPTPAFYQRYQDEIGGFVGALLRVRGTNGSASVPAITQAARRTFGDSLQEVASVAVETEGARDAIDVLTVALWIFAGVAALAGATAVGIVAIRQIGTVRDEQDTQAALGLTGRQRALAAVVLLLPAAVAGAVLAVLAAIFLSPLLPFGVARKAEVDPGIRIDSLVLGLGLLAVNAFVVVVGGVAAWRVARSATRDRDARAVGRPSAVSRASERASASPAFATGLRMALEPGRGPRAVPVRSAVLGATFGTLGIVAVLVFSASLDHLADSPRVYGWSWDTVVSPAQPPTANNPNQCGDVTTDVMHDPSLAAVTAVCLENIEVDGHPVEGWGFTSLRGRIEPTIVTGRAPRRSDEIALGATALHAIGKSVGDTVDVRGDRTRAYRIVGQAVLPTVSSDDPEPMADGAAFTGAGLQRVFEPITSPNISFMARFAPGVRVSQFPSTSTGFVKLSTGFATLPAVPVEVDRLLEVDHLPAVLGGLLGLLAAVAVTHAVALTVRRRRHDFAVLRTFGFRRRDVRSAIAYQATVLAVVALVVGVPAGLAVGALVWRAVADGLGVATVISVPVLAVAAVCAGAFVVTNVIGALAASAAIRQRPAATLATE
jgi:ABC-type lipoprotein release transport system permease subunit